MDFNRSDSTTGETILSNLPQTGVTTVCPSTAAEYEGEKKWKRTFIGNLVPDKEGDGYNLYIPEGIAVSGRLRIQPKQEKEDGQESSL